MLLLLSKADILLSSTKYILIWMKGSQCLPWLLSAKQGEKATIIGWKQPITKYITAKQIKPTTITATITTATTITATTTIATTNTITNTNTKTNTAQRGGQAAVYFFFLLFQKYCLMEDLRRSPSLYSTNLPDFPVVKSHICLNNLAILSIANLSTFSGRGIIIKAVILGCLYWPERNSQYDLIKESTDYEQHSRS